MKCFIFEGSFRVSVHRFLHGIGVFEIFHFSVSCYMSVGHPYLPAHPRDAINVSLIDSAFGRVAYGYVVCDGIVQDVIKAGITFRNLINVYCHCVVWMKVTTILYHPGGRFRISRVIRSYVVQPIAEFCFAEP